MRISYWSSDVCSSDLQTHQEQEGKSMTHNFHPTSLREYDIRGIVGETLPEKDDYAIGRGFGTLIARAGGRRVAVGYAGLLSSPALWPACIDGLTGSGLNAERIGVRRAVECREGQRGISK